MKYRKLGSSDLEVSEISLGSWLTYSGGVSARADPRLHRRGVRGRHQLLRHRQRLRPGRRRDRVGRDPLRPPARLLRARDQGLGPDVGRPGRPRPLGGADRQADRRLARAAADRLRRPLPGHRFDPDVPIEETIEALQQVVADGKARYLGFSEWTPEQIQAAIDIAGPDLFVSSQPQYSMLWQAPEAEVFALCAANGISQIVWSPLGQGVLTGKYQPGEAPPPGSRAASSADERRHEPGDERRDARGRPAPAPDRRRTRACRMAELALAWVLRRAELASAIVGASRPEQVHANAEGVGHRALAGHARGDRRSPGRRAGHRTHPGAVRPVRDHPPLMIMGLLGPSPSNPMITAGARCAGLIQPDTLPSTFNLAASSASVGPAMYR